MKIECRLNVVRQTSAHCSESETSPREYDITYREHAFMKDDSFIKPAGAKQHRYVLGADNWATLSSYNKMLRVY
jgi:hypothetical protein